MILNNSIRTLCMALLCSGSFIIAAELPVLTHKNTTFGSDLHLVALDKDQTKRTTIKQDLTAAIKTALWEDVMQFKLYTPLKLIVSIIRLNINYKDISGEGYYHLFQQYNKAHCAELARKISRAYNLIEEMVPVYRSLNAQGFTIRAMSNVGSTFYNDLVADHSQLFKYFKPGTYVRFTNADGSFNWNMVKKPEPAFFQEHYDNFVRGSFKYCVFIDDKKENVDAARRFTTQDGRRPYIGIHFDRSLPIEQAVVKLRSDLQKYGITV